MTGVNPPVVTVVGVGPAGAELVTAGALGILEGTQAPVLVRTSRHPAVEALARPGGPLAGATTLDGIYDRSATLDEVYAGISEAVVEAASDAGSACYVVPGSPGVAERSVELLRDDPRVRVEVVPALSFADLAWIRLGVDPLARGVRIVDGQRFAVEAAGERGPLLVAQCDSRLVLSEVKLAVEEGPEAGVWLLQRLGLVDEVITQVAWEDLDREIQPDHLTSLYIPELAAPVASELAGLVELMHVLRRECPWDRDQTHRSLARHLIEESYEVLEAIDGVDPDTGDGYAALAEELGDLMFQVVFHAELAAEEGRFTLADVAREVHAKLVARHPHVFADLKVDGPVAVEANWEAIKRAEKGRRSAMDGLPPALPALLLALKSHERAARAGMPFPSVDSAFAKVAEELGEVRADPGESELGDLLFASVGLAHELGVEPEGALRRAAGRFGARVRAMEARAAAEGTDLASAGQEVLDRWWEEAKAEAEAEAEAEAGNSDAAEAEAGSSAIHGHRPDAGYR